MRFYNRRTFAQDQFIDDLNELNNELLRFLKNDKKIMIAQYADFYIKINARNALFQQAYLKAGCSVNKKKEVITQYNHYLQTWKNCLNEKNPRFINGHISFYHEPIHYKPVGCFNYHRPSTAKKIACGSTILLGMLGVVGGIIASPFCLVAGIPLITASVIAILTATLVLVDSKQLKDDEFKQAEKDLFMEGIEIAKDIACKESANNNEFNGKETLGKRIGYH